MVRGGSGGWDICAERLAEIHGVVAEQRGGREKVLGWGGASARLAILTEMLDDRCGLHVWDRDAIAGMVIEQLYRCSLVQQQPCGLPTIEKEYVSIIRTYLQQSQS